MGLFNDWGVNNLTFKRKVKRKVSKKYSLKKRKEPVNYEHRTYTDFLAFKASHPDIPTTEMDTIYNSQSGPYIQTFIFENIPFMIDILHQNKTADSMSKTLNYFQDILTDKDFKNLFSLLLTDRGTEFAKPIRFENTETGEIRSKIFYCDPQQSSQKPHIEKNHNLVREILPNGQDWSNLTQEKVNLMFSHINSVSRESIGGKTPYDLFTFIYGIEVADKLNIQKIKEDEVTTTPHLLKI